MCFSPFFNKVAGVKPGNFIKRDTGVFLWILQNFLEHFFAEHPRMTTSRS